MSDESTPQTPTPERPARYTLTLRDAGGPQDAPAAVRLRSFLKALLRGWKFRCETIRQEEEPDRE